MEEKKNNKSIGVLNATMGAVAGATGTLGVSGLVNNNKPSQEEIEEEEVAQNTVPNHHFQGNGQHTDDGDIEDNIVDNGTAPTNNAIDDSEIHPVDSSGSITEVFNAELLDVNPDAVAQEIILGAGEADSYLAVHSVDGAVTDESIWSEEETLNDITVDDQADASELFDEEEVGEDELDEEVEEDLADSDASDDIGEILDDII